MKRQLSRAVFLRRLGTHFVGGMVFVLVSLAIGMAGYEYFEDLAWRDAFLNAAMLLGGMGPVDAPQTPGGKIFAGVMLVPVLHNVLHRFHWEIRDEK